MISLPHFCPEQIFFTFFFYHNCSSTPISLDLASTETARALDVGDETSSTIREDSLQSLADGMASMPVIGAK